MADRLPIHRLAERLTLRRSLCTWCHENERQPGSKFCSVECDAQMAEAAAY